MPPTKPGFIWVRAVESSNLFGEERSTGTGKTVELEVERDADGEIQSVKLDGRPVELLEETPSEIIIRDPDTGERKTLRKPAEDPTPGAAVMESANARRFADRLRGPVRRGDPSIAQRVQTPERLRAVETATMQHDMRTDRLVAVALQQLLSPGERKRLDELPTEQREEFLSELREAVAARDPGEADRLQQLRDKLRERLEEQDRVGQSIREKNTVNVAKW